MNKYHYYLPASTTPLDPVAEATHPGEASQGGEAAAPPLKSPVKNGATTGTRSRHERKCSVCRHPDRDAIEEAFLHWQSPNEIATDYDLPDPRPVLRHAYATGLLARRKRNLRFVLDNFLERVNEIQDVTAGAIVRAVRAYTCVTDDGEWVEPPKHIKITHVRASEDSFTPDPPQAGEGHVRASEDTFTPLAATRSGGDPPQAGDVATGPRLPRRRAGRKTPNKLNANRPPAELAKVSNH